MGAAVLHMMPGLPLVKGGRLYCSIEGCDEPPIGIAGWPAGGGWFAYCPRHRDRWLDLVQRAQIRGVWIEREP